MTVLARSGPGCPPLHLGDDVEDPQRAHLAGQGRSHGAADHAGPGCSRATPRGVVPTVGPGCRSPRRPRNNANTGAETPRSGTCTCTPPSPGCAPPCEWEAAEPIVWLRRSDDKLLALGRIRRHGSLPGPFPPASAAACASSTARRAAPRLESRGLPGTLMRTAQRGLTAALIFPAARARGRAAGLADGSLGGISEPLRLSSGCANHACSCDRFG